MAQETETLPLLRGTATLKSALEEEEDMLLDLNYPDRRIDFFVSLYLNREEIENIASFHLGLHSSDTCQTGKVNEWLHGSFNACIPLYINKRNQNSNPEKRMRRGCVNGSNTRVRLDVLFVYFVLHMHRRVFI